MYGQLINECLEALRSDSPCGLCEEAKHGNSPHRRTAPPQQPAGAGVTESLATIYTQGNNMKYKKLAESAAQALMELENIRIVKEMRNSVNRKVNCETANLNKTVSAALRQVADIEYIRDTKGLDFLSPQLEEMARVRLEAPEASLLELGSMLETPVGKSGVNHRLRKISEIADALRGARN